MLVHRFLILFFVFVLSACGGGSSPSSPSSADLPKPASTPTKGVPTSSPEAIPAEQSTQAKPKEEPQTSASGQSDSTTPTPAAVPVPGSSPVSPSERDSKIPQTAPAATWDTKAHLPKLVDLDQLLFVFPIVFYDISLEPNFVYRADKAVRIPISWRFKDVSDKAPESYTPPYPLADVEYRQFVQSTDGKLFFGVSASGKKLHVHSYAWQTPEVAEKAIPEVFRKAFLLSGTANQLVFLTKNQDRGNRLVLQIGKWDLKTNRVGFTELSAPACTEKLDQDQNPKCWEVWKKDVVTYFAAEDVLVASRIDGFGRSLRSGIRIFNFRTKHYADFRLDSVSRPVYDAAKKQIVFLSYSGEGTGSMFGPNERTALKLSAYDLNGVEQPARFKDVNEILAREPMHRPDVDFSNHSGAHGESRMAVFGRKLVMTFTRGEVYVVDLSTDQFVSMTHVPLENKRLSGINVSADMNGNGFVVQTNEGLTSSSYDGVMYLFK